MILKFRIETLWQIHRSLITTTAPVPSSRLFEGWKVQYGPVWYKNTLEMQYLEFKRDKYFRRVYTKKLNPIDQPYSTFFQSRAKSECCKVLAGHSSQQV